MMTKDRQKMKKGNNFLLKHHKIEGKFSRQRLIRDPEPVFFLDPA